MRVQWLGYLASIEFAQRMSQSTPRSFTTTGQAGQFTSTADSSLLNAVNWISDLLFGPLATSIAVIAIGWLGFLMLQGRMDPRKALSVVVGCFLIFGARLIADGVLSPSSYAIERPIADKSAPVSQPIVHPSANKANAFDPYSGATASSLE
jgi:type IV secretory pathway VirB2 component (pilin)